MKLEHSTPRTLVVLGGGSPFTAALIDALAAASGVKPRVLVLHGRDSPRLKVVVGYGAARLQSLGWDVRGETDMALALAEASTVIHQIRYGGLETRGAGEELCARHHIAADETLGPAALLTAIRLRDDLNQTCDLLQRHCPNAWVLNLTNPLSCVTALMAERGVRNCLGLCELPASTAHQVAKLLGVRFGDLTWSYTGLNHRGFLHDLRVNGQDVLDDLLRTLGSDSFEGIPAADIASLRAVPLKYFRLVRRDADLPPSRAPFLSDLREQLFAELAVHPTVSPPSLRQRDLSWYSQAVVPVLAALESSTPERLIVNRVAADGLVHEHAVWISQDHWEPVASRVRRTGTLARRASGDGQECPSYQNATPPISAAAQCWLECFETHEWLFLDAVRNPSRSRIREVLANDPLVPADKVAQLESELWERVEPGSGLQISFLAPQSTSGHNSTSPFQAESWHIREAKNEI